jgi:hypothetical protein
MWTASEIKTDADIHAECVTFLGLVHEDYSEIDVIYALLALSTFHDALWGHMQRQWVSGRACKLPVAGLNCTAPV